MLELLTHFVGLLVQLLDLNFSGSNIALKFLDLVVEDELELLQLLSLLLQLVYLLLPVTYQLVFRRDLRSLFSDLLLQRLQYLGLGADLNTLLLFVSFEFFDVTFEIRVLVLGELQLSLRLEGHFIDLGLVVGILLVDFVDLVLGISTDLVEGLVIVLANLPYIVAQLLRRVLSRLHVLAELFQLFCHTLVVFFDDTVDFVLVF